jgi:photosystem II stability/assembly factor-like uncharacterized protein
MRARLRSPLVILLAGALFAPTPVASAQQADSALFDVLQWTNVGPNRGGRSIAVAGSDSRVHEYYFGATGGGLWKTTDGGTTWRPVTDGQLGSSSVGAVAVCEANPDVVYIGMGESELRGNVEQGDGVYKSTDAGKTWKHMGLAATQNVSKIRVAPGGCDTVYVAAFGVTSAPNPERGVYKTTDGGKSWKKVLYRDEKSGAIELVIDPNHPNVLYASLWQAWRKSWGFSSGGPGSGLFKSTDAGEHWTEITDRLGLKPASPIGKIGIAVSPANSDRVWALVEHEPMGGLYRSDDEGKTWKRVNADRKLRQRAFYYSRIYADPKDENVVYALNTGFWKSTDGGKTFKTSLRVPHGDNHDLWIAPSDPSRMIEADDGGATVSVDGGKTWTAEDYPTAQIYRVATTTNVPYHICGAQQDNSTVCVPSSDWRFVTADAEYYYSVGGGESGYIAPDPTDPNIFYAGSYGGDLTRFDHATGLRQAVNVWPDNPMGHSAKDMRERVQWTFPIVFAPTDPHVLYTASQKVWKTTNEGQSWTAISGDLTRHDTATMGPAGGPITKDQSGVETYATVFAIAPSYHDPNVIWAGSDDGYVQITQDATAEHPTWTNVTPPDAPDFIRINTIEASPTTPGKAYVAGIRYLVDNDRHPYVWKTTDYGRTWTKIVNGIPDNDFVRSIREDPERPGLLYAGSETTVYVSWDDGAHWQPLTQNLPNVQVADLTVKGNDLVIATHGRSFWVMHGIDVLRQMSPQVDTAAFWLFDPASPVQGIDRSADMVYHLKSDARKVSVAILNPQGSVVQSWDSAPDSVTKDSTGTHAEEGGPRRGQREMHPSNKAGTHRFAWDMRTKGWTNFPGSIFWAARAVGPRVIPGTYQVRLTVDGRSQTRSFRVVMNPRLQKSGVTLADLQERFDFATRIRDRVSQANEAVIRIRKMDAQIDDRVGKSSAADLHALADSVKDRLGVVESAIYQVKNKADEDPLNFPIELNNKLAALMSLVDGSDGKPTAQSHEVFQVLSNALGTQLGKLDAIMQNDVGRLNERLRSSGLKPVETSGESRP